MDSKDIPKEARAKHLLTLLNSKATAAIVGLPADSKDDIDIASGNILLFQPSLWLPSQQIQWPCWYSQSGL